MSFILDALKKLEQNRRHDSVPNLSTVHTAHLHKARKRSPWPYLLSGALLLNAGIMTVWLSPWRSGPVDIIAASPLENDQEPHVRELSEKDESSQPDLISPESSIEVLHSSTSTRDTELSDPVKSDDDHVEPLELTPSPEEIESLKDTIRKEQGLTDSEGETRDTFVEPAESGKSGAEQEIPELSEIPSELRKDIPEISIFGHIYSSSPPSRLANINGSLVREGDTVVGRLRVKEITMNGIIFDYKGLHFRIRAF